jgi:hypothetical protein
MGELLINIIYAEDYVGVLEGAQAWKGIPYVWSSAFRRQSPETA